MPLDDTSAWPAGLDSFPFIDPTQGLGTTNEEGDLFLNKLANAIVALETRTGRTVTPPAGSDRHGFEEHLVAYTPAAFGIGGLVSPSTWTGWYARSGHHGVVFAAGKVTGTWTGPAGTSYLEVSLPAGWLAHPTAETVRGNCWIGINPSFGVHYTMMPVVHPGANRIRFITPNIVTIGSELVMSAHQLAANGVQIPAQFTGDGTPANQDDIFVSLEMWVQ